MTIRLTRFLPTVATVFALAAIPAVDAARAADALIPMRDGFPTLAPLVEKVTPAVVNIAVKAKIDLSDNPLFNDPRFRRRFELPDNLPPRSSVGSGVIIDAKKGYVLTNNHVIDEATEIEVKLLDKRVLTAKVIGGDKDTDIAVLQIDAKDLSALPMGDSGTLKVGDYVLAVGNPFGLNQTVTSGIVSALGRSMNGTIESYEDFIQTDASINPGNSGGALVNLKGELIGINTAIIGPAGGNVGVGFAVPTSMVKAVMGQLIEFGTVKRGRIGVGIQDLNPELAKNLGIDRAEGALIGSIEKGSPADTAGLKPGDVAIEMDGKPLKSYMELRNRIGMMTVGTAINLVVLRNGAKKEFKVTIGKNPEPEAPVVAKLEERTPLQGATFANTATGDKVKGVRITEIARGSPAQQSQLQEGDVIVAVNRKGVGNVEEFTAAMKSSPRSTVLAIKRGEEDRIVVIQ